MIKLLCQNCGQTWYTANTKPNQRCSECGKILIEEELSVLKEDLDRDRLTITKDYKSNVVYVNW